jgi:hypothetical protein
LGLTPMTLTGDSIFRRKTRSTAWTVRKNGLNPLFYLQELSKHLMAKISNKSRSDSELMRKKAPRSMMMAGNSLAGATDTTLGMMSPASWCRDSGLPIFGIRK